MLTSNCFCELFLLLLLPLSCLVQSAPKTVGAVEYLDLSHATIVSSPETRHLKAAELLQTEISNRTGVTLPKSSVMPTSEEPIIALGTVAQFPTDFRLPTGLSIPKAAEGYCIWVEAAAEGAPIVILVGRDDRGTLFAAGRLIRLLSLGPDRVALDSRLQIETAPAYPIRGQMLLPKRQDFITWDLAGYEQMIRDLVIFGTNGFELILNPNNAVLPEIAEIINAYGLDLWVNLSGQTQSNLRESMREGTWRHSPERRLLKSLKNVTAVHVKGGDTGNPAPPRTVLPWMDQFAPLLEECCPGAKMWYSIQCQQEHAVHDNAYVFDYIATQRPQWLEGIIFGPWSDLSMEELRKKLPAEYRTRHHPDICHNRGSQYPVPRWDRALARTWGRNGISVRPRQMARIHNVYAPFTAGFMAYNHTGCSNDINKFVWSGMAWNPKTDLEGLLTEYGRVFFGEDLAAEVARGLLMLEDNWKGPLARNPGVEPTLTHWQRIARQDNTASENWRMELFLSRAFIDAFVKRKLEAEMELQAEAYDELQKAAVNGVERAVVASSAALFRIDDEYPSKEDLIQELISWELDKYGDLPEVLDNLFCSLSDRQWLEGEFAKILKFDSTPEQLARIDQIVNWENPGPGGFYDDLGVEGKQPHLIRQRQWEDDPGFIYSPIEFQSHKPNSRFKQSWLVSALTRYDTPLLVRYEGLDPNAVYRLRMTYKGPYAATMKCKTDDGFLIHGSRGGTGEMPLEFDIPAAATADRVLQLEWRRTNVVRGPSVSEIWLIRSDSRSLMEKE